MCYFTNFKQILLANILSFLLSDIFLFSVYSLFILFLYLLSFFSFSFLLFFFPFFPFLLFFAIYINAFSIPCLRPCEHKDELKAITLEHCCVTQHSFHSRNGNPFVWRLHLDFLAKCRLNRRINKKGSKYVEQGKDGDEKEK